jgi:glutaconate CoA-transferase subunit B
MAEFTDRELMVVAAGREIQDDELVFVGMRLPWWPSPSPSTHARRRRRFENGIIRDRPAPRR